MEKQLYKLLNDFQLEATGDGRYGVWVEDNNDKNQAVKMFTIVDLRNWLFQRMINKSKEKPCPKKK